MEEGFPGELRASVTYELTAQRLTLRYEATTDRPTVCSLTNHSFFNLAGVHSATPVLGHTIRLAAAAYTPVDATAIPLGPIERVEGTIFDLTAETVIGSRFDEMSSEARTCERPSTAGASAATGEDGTRQREHVACNAPPDCGTRCTALARAMQRTA